MHHVSHTQALRPAPRRRRKNRRVPKRLDGRTQNGLRVKALTRQFAEQLGGKLTDGQRMFVERAAVFTALAEDTRLRRLNGDTRITLDDVNRIERTARLCVRDLGLDRKREPEPGLAALLGGHHADRS